MTSLLNSITPFLTKTTAIMTTVIILVFVAAWLISTEKKINRGTVEKLLKLIKSVVFSLIALEFFSGAIEAFKFYLTSKRG